MPGVRARAHVTLLCELTGRHLAIDNRGAARDGEGLRDKLGVI
jgi:hypothetical protein